MTNFNYYLLAINAIGFTLFMIYMYSDAAEEDRVESLIPS